MDVKFIEIDGELAVAVYREDLDSEENMLLLAKFLDFQYRDQDIYYTGEELVEKIEDSLPVIDEENWGLVVFHIEDERLWVGDGELYL